MQDQNNSRDCDGPGTKSQSTLLDIRVKMDTRIFENQAPREWKNLKRQAQLVANEIYSIKGWRFDKARMMVGLAYAETALNHEDGHETLFFSLDWAHSGVYDRFDRLQIMVSEKGKTVNAYHGWKSMWRRFQDGSLAEIIV